MSTVSALMSGPGLWVAAHSDVLWGALTSALFYLHFNLGRTGHLLDVFEGLLRLGKRVCRWTGSLRHRRDCPNVPIIAEPIPGDLP
jgi:hypothetical protein